MRQLLFELQQIQSHHVLLWCFSGDFNTIFCAYEHRGRFPPARTHMNDLCEWTYCSNLIHLPTRGSQFTWYHGRSENIYTEIRLDTAICNQLWIDSY